MLFVAYSCNKTFLLSIELSEKNNEPYPQLPTNTRTLHLFRQRLGLTCYMPCYTIESFFLFECGQVSIILIVHENRFKILRSLFDYEKFENYKLGSKFKCNLNYLSF